MGRSLWALSRLCPDGRARARLFAVYFKLLVTGRRGARRSVPPERLRLQLNGTQRDWWVADAGEVGALWEIFVAEQYGDFLPADARLIFDAGANVGTATAWFRLRCPQARVVAIEADPFACERLRRNVGSDPGVEIVHAALSDTDGTVTFLRARWTMRGHLEGVPGDGVSGAHEDTIEVRGVTLRTLREQLVGGNPVDLLKVDIEGSEWRVLSGTLDGIRAVTLEVHHPTPDGSQPDRLLAEIAERAGLSLKHGSLPTIRWLLS